MGLKNEFETAVVNEPSVSEALKVYSIPSQFALTLVFADKISALMHVVDDSDHVILQGFDCQYANT